MPTKLLTNKTLLIALGIVAILGLLFISYNATQTTKQISRPTQPPFQPKTATLPPPKKDKPVTGQIIVKFNPQYTDTQINEHLKQYHASIIKKIEGIDQTVVKVPAGQEETIMQKLQSDPYVQTAQRDYTTHAFFVPDDQGFGLQYALNNTGQSIQGQRGTPQADVHAETAWNVTRGSGIKVAVLDTGINLNQPDLAGKVVGAKSFVSNTVEDGNGHGTHVAGIIAADTNNGIGVAGTCPNCQLLIGKILDDTGNGTTSNAVAGITWAADQGAKVINMSIGTTDPNTASIYDQAIAYAMSKGAVVVAAAGNDGTSQLTYPAAATNAISVAGTDNNDQKASWSNYGTWVKVAAPGKNILSTAPTHSFQLEPFGYNTASPYMYLSGSSMATPVVSGVAALIASTPYGTTPQSLMNRLFATADKISGTGTDWVYGRVDAANAVGPVPTTTPVPTSANITPTLYCVGGNGTPPCATIPAPSSAPGSTINPSVVITGPATGGSTTPSGSPTPEASISPSPTASGSANPGGPLCKNIKITNVFYNLASKQIGKSTATTSKVHIKCHSGGDQDHDNPNNGLPSKFIALLLKFLQLLLQWILNCTVHIGSPVSGAPSISPSPAPSVSPSTSTSASPAPSGATSTTPTATPTPPTGAVLPVGQTGTWSMIFNDEFNGTSLDKSKWITCYPVGMCTNNGNKELEWYQAANVTEGNGYLTLQGKKQTVKGGGKTFNYTSGMIASHFSFTYGYMEIRAKIPKGKGYWPAFWTLPANNTWPPEIDVMEILGDTSNIVHMTYHWSASDQQSGTDWTGPDFSGGWHTYAADWEPNAITWYIDGVKRKTFTNTGAIYNKPMVLLADLAIGGDWPGSPNSSTVFPGNYQIDYIRVWKKQ